METTMLRISKYLLVYSAVISLLLQPAAVISQPASSDPDPSSTQGETRIYLSDGSVVQGRLLEKSADLIILRVDEKIFTFDPQTEVDKIVTLNSLGADARIITTTEFPYISFLGGTLAFGLLSALQFDTASDRKREAQVNEDNKLFGRAKDLRGKRDRARLWGWSSAVLAVGTLGVALIPKKRTRRVFPEANLTTAKDGTLALHIGIRGEF